MTKERLLRLIYLSSINIKELPFYYNIDKIESDLKQLEREFFEPYVIKHS